jgi:hypothetical protein
MRDLAYFPNYVDPRRKRQCKLKSVALRSKWTEGAVQAFKRLKAILRIAVTMPYPKDHHETCLPTDAAESHYGLQVMGFLISSVL